MLEPPKAPEPFLEVRQHNIDWMPTLCGLCVGYESGHWRYERLADHLIEWLPEFALSASERDMIEHSNSVAMIRRATRAIYASEKYKSRGEFGEILLHAAVRQVHNSIPAISKIFYKDSANDTVKGFDAIHVVGPPNDMELWLGEAKFYSNIRSAIKDVAAELRDHLKVDFLRSEFLFIANKLDEQWEHTAQLNRLLSPNTSLDDVFRRVCVPVLLTYDSKCVSGNTEVCDAYASAFSEEVEQHHDEFAQAISAIELPSAVRVHLFLVPLHTKRDLVRVLDRKLKTWQSL